MLKLSALTVCLLFAPHLARGQASARPALTFEAELTTAAYHEPSVPNVSVHVPPGFDATRALHVVVFVHGLRGCLPVLMGEGESRCDEDAPPQLGWNLGAHHDAANTNSIFVVPRLVYGKRGSQPGAFGKPGGFAAFLDDVLAGPLSERLGKKLARSNVASVTLVAHSAGYETAIAILDRGGLGSLIRAVVLFDALYALEERYARYAQAHAGEGFRLVVVHVRGGKPARIGQALEQRLRRALGAERVAKARANELSAAVAAHPFVFAEGRGPHGRVPHNHMAEVLAALGLPARKLAP